MNFAHQGIEIKAIPGVPNTPMPAAPQVAAHAAPAPDPNAATRPVMLTKRATDVLLRIERMMDNAVRALPTASTPQRGAGVATPDAVAAAAAAPAPAAPTDRN
jgi:penicillin-binding protein 1A